MVLLSRVVFDRSCESSLAAQCPRRRITRRETVRQGRVNHIFREFLLNRNIRHCFPPDSRKAETRIRNSKTNSTDQRRHCSRFAFVNPSAVLFYEPVPCLSGVTAWCSAKQRSNRWRSTGERASVPCGAARRY